MTASVAIQSLPVAENSDELVRIVDEVIDYIKSTGLHYYVGPFETTIEGDDYDQLMDIVKECQHVAIRAGAPKVSATSRWSMSRRARSSPLTKKSPSTIRPDGRIVFSAVLEKDAHEGVFFCFPTVPPPTVLKTGVAPARHTVRGL